MSFPLRTTRTTNAPQVGYFEADSEGDLDPLDAGENQLFGFAAEFEPLKAPPVPKAGLIGGKKVGEGATPGEGPVHRVIKRPKAIKVGGLQEKRKGQRQHDHYYRNAAGEHEYIVNRDYCESCTEKGEFLCCEGCPRSFHFECLDPPITPEDVRDLASWFCNICRPRPVPYEVPKNNLLTQLIERTYSDIPRAFQLSATIKTAFKNVAAGTHGEYVNAGLIKPQKANRVGGYDPLDPFKLKDKSGKLALCYHCQLAASEVKNKRIVGCNFCEQHWHLDCLDPPLAVLPPTGRKWMCPLHIEHIAPKLRESRIPTILNVTQRGMANSGNINVLSAPQPAKVEPQFEELTHHGIRYQVPEETIILDFWAKATRKGKAPAKRKPAAKPVKVAKTSKKELHDPDTSDLSSIESSDDLEDEEKLEPQVAVVDSRASNSQATLKPPVIDKREDSVESIAASASSLTSVDGADSRKASASQTLAEKKDMDAYVPSRRRPVATGPMLNPKKRKAPPSALGTAQAEANETEKRPHTSVLPEPRPMVTPSSLQTVQSANQLTISSNNQLGKIESPSTLTPTIQQLSTMSPQIARAVRDFDIVPKKQKLAKGQEAPSNGIGDSTTDSQSTTPTIPSGVASPLKIRLALPAMKKRRTENSSSASSANEDTTTGMDLDDQSALNSQPLSRLSSGDSGKRSTGKGSAVASAL